jgi:Tfp pilus assembly protein PilV
MNYNQKPECGFSKTRVSFRDQQGLGLAETLVAVAILGAAAITFISALSTGSIAAGEQKTEVIAQGLVRSQMEYTKSYPFNPSASTYPLIMAPADYSLSVAVGAVPDTDADIQKITVTVSSGGQDLLTVADYKVNR